MSTLVSKKCTFLILLLTIFSGVVFSQSTAPATKPLTRQEIMTKFEPRMIYPLINGGKMTGVLPVENIINNPPGRKTIKLIFDFTQATANNAQGTHVNEGLEEVARTMNLHIGAGIKKESLKAVIIFHSVSLLTVLNNEYYEAKYGSSNPNIELLNKLLATGTELVVCGQSMQYRELEPKKLLPKVQMSFSAKTTLSKYQADGYIVFPINEKE